MNTTSSMATFIFFMFVASIFFVVMAKWWYKNQPSEKDKRCTCCGRKFCTDYECLTDDDCFNGEF